MKTTDLIRWSGVAAILAGLLGVVSAFFDENTPAAYASVYIISSLLTILALIGIYLYQRDEAGVWGLLGFVVTMVGNLMLFFESLIMIGGGIYALGLILMAIGALKANKFSRWIPVLWIIAPLVGAPGFFAESLTNVFFILGAIAYGLGFIGAGYTLWKQTEEAAVLEAS